jgi:hypothetical protein
MFSRFILSLILLTDCVVTEPFDPWLCMMNFCLFGVVLWANSATGADGSLF